MTFPDLAYKKIGHKSSRNLAPRASKNTVSKVYMHNREKPCFSMGPIKIEKKRFFIGFSIGFWDSTAFLDWHPPMYISITEWHFLHGHDSIGKVPGIFTSTSIGECQQEWQLHELSGIWPIPNCNWTWKSSWTREKTVFSIFLAFFQSISGIQLESESEIWANFLSKWNRNLNHISNHFHSTKLYGLYFL